MARKKLATDVENAADAKLPGDAAEDAADNNGAVSLSKAMQAVRSPKARKGRKAKAAPPFPRRTGY